MQKERVHIYFILKVFYTYHFYNGVKEKGKKI